MLLRLCLPICVQHYKYRPALLINKAQVASHVTSVTKVRHIAVPDTLLITTFT